MTTGTILDPRVVGSGAARDRGPDAGDFAGKKVGLRRDQFWTCWDWVTDVWAAALREAGATPVVWRAPVERSDKAKEATEDFAAFLDEIDVAVIGLCNCGSCSMWAIHDTLAALDRGLPTVTVATAHFERLARSLAEVGGRPDIRLVVLPYPLEGREEGDVRAIAAGAFLSMVAELGGRVRVGASS